MTAETRPCIHKYKRVKRHWECRKCGYSTMESRRGRKGFHLPAYVNPPLRDEWNGSDDNAIKTLEG